MLLPGPATAVLDRISKTPFLAPRYCEICGQKGTAPAEQPASVSTTPTFSVTSGGTPSPSLPEDSGDLVPGGFLLDLVLFPVDVTPLLPAEIKVLKSLHLGRA